MVLYCSTVKVTHVIICTIGMVRTELGDDLWLQVGDIMAGVAGDGLVGTHQHCRTP